MRRIVILDTSILCVWLRVPGKDTCGSGETLRSFELVLPLAAIIETGNHISQAPSLRFETAEALTNLMRQCAAGQSPWAAFLKELAYWNDVGLIQLANEWPRLAAEKFSMGDATIKRVAEFYAQMGHPINLLTGDDGLRAYQPRTPPNPPRRRRH